MAQYRLFFETPEEKELVMKTIRACKDERQQLLHRSAINLQPDLANSTRPNRSAARSFITFDFSTWSNKLIGQMKSKQTGVPMIDHTTFFLGSDAVEWLWENLSVTKDEAVDFFQQALDDGLIKSDNGSTTFQLDSKFSWM